MRDFKLDYHSALLSLGTHLAVDMLTTQSGGFCLLKNECGDELIYCEKEGG